MEMVAISRFTLTFAAVQIQISMTQVEKFQDNEIPFEVLASFGLSKEMVEDLPMKVLETLLNGLRTPLLPISIQDKKGNHVISSARLSLVRTEDGVDVMFMPYGEVPCLKPLNFNSKRFFEMERFCIRKLTITITSWMEQPIRLYPCQLMSSSTTLVFWEDKWTWKRNRRRFSD